MALATGCASDFTRDADSSRIEPVPTVDSKQAEAPEAESSPANAGTQERGTPDTIRVPEDLWDRIRVGMAMERHPDRRAVRRWVQFYTSRHDHLENAIRNARPFLWHVVSEIESRDMPAELALLPIVESAYDPTAYSYASASGLWQFMPFTARRFGLQDNWWHDGRRDVLLSTTAALDYLEWLHGRYDDWLLALAAYNAGEGRVDRALARTEADNRPADFWHLDLPRETENYVPKLLALGRILAEPQRFSFDWPRMPDEPLTELVSLPGQIELAIAADMMDVSEDRLRRLNPGVRRWATHPDGPHRLLIPAGKTKALRTALEQRDPGSLVTWRRHQVARGEVLGTIARRYGTSVALLQKVNNLSGSLIRAGQHLLIPQGGEAASAPVMASGNSDLHHTVASGDSLWTIARRYGTQVANLRRWNDLAPNAVLQPGQRLVIRSRGTGTRRYRVRRGDSLWTIARRFNVGVSELCAWNNLSEDAVLRPGQVLVIEGGDETSEYYQVRAGDSLWSIASRFSVAVDDLKSWNNIDQATIRPGQRLRVTSGDSTG